MSLIIEFIANVVLLWTGGLLRFAVHRCWLKVRNRPAEHSLQEYIYGSGRENDLWASSLPHRFVNRLGGVVILLLILFFSIRLSQ